MDEDDAKRMQRDAILKKKSESSIRWIILLFSCLMYIGPYYCFDIPAALKVQFQEYMGNPLNYEAKFQLLYTLASAPNVSRYH